MYKMVQEDTKFPLVKGKPLRNSRRVFDTICGVEMISN